MTEDFLRVAEAELSIKDPLLAVIINKNPLAPLPARHDYFASLCRSIIGQQVSVAAAQAIYGRFEEMSQLKPNVTLELSEENCKYIGLSRQKTAYIKDLASHFANDPSVYNHLESRTDEHIIEELTEINGIGPWTAQMFMIFTLGRPNIFAPDDVGLQKAMTKLYGWKTLPAKKLLINTAHKWTPYKTVASLHLWQSLEA